MGRAVFVDSEIGLCDRRIKDLGAVTDDGAGFHSSDGAKFAEFAKPFEYVVGHNIIHHDLEYIGSLLPGRHVFIDTLYLSPLLFPKRPYHSLVKDDKLRADDLNNPLSDSKKARDLFHDEVEAFQSLPGEIRRIFCSLLSGVREFEGFFKYLGCRVFPASASFIKAVFFGKICDNADLDGLMEAYPVELAYALAIIWCGDGRSITPPWIVRNYPRFGNVMRKLRGTLCGKCAYCDSVLNVRRQLKRIFGFDSFNTFGGEPLQERAVEAGIRNESLLAIFPTGGGKSLAFQLPALIAGETVRGLTVVISPLQALMRDQVEGLANKGIPGATAIYGLLSPPERAEAMEMVRDGTASILYVAPESLRSRTVENLLLSRNVARFVIDEAHCLSAWGQDFRVDYLFIAEFIDRICKKKNSPGPIPVSCFTATAKPKVVSDIREYFRKSLGVELKIFATAATRENLRYNVLYEESENDKYNTLRDLLSRRDCPSIVYVSRTLKTEELAGRLTRDGFPAVPFHGKMDPRRKVENQKAFMTDRVRIIVATSAFGMGVDKRDVGLVIHYDISASLEDYIQEAGRAGRDPGISAECYILYNDDDLDKQFVLLNQSKLSLSEIQQVWKAVKSLSGKRESVVCSALEIAKAAGWSDNVHNVETRVRAAIAALESAGYVERGLNAPRIYATSIISKTVGEIAARVNGSSLLDEDEKKTAKRIIDLLIGGRTAPGPGSEGIESRVDYMADVLGVPRADVVYCVNALRQIGVLSDENDMTAFIAAETVRNKAAVILERFALLEKFLLSRLPEQGTKVNLKELNDSAVKAGIAGSSTGNIRKILYYWTIKNYIRKNEYYSRDIVTISPVMKTSELAARLTPRLELARFAVEKLFAAAVGKESSDGAVPVRFSVVRLMNAYNAQCGEGNRADLRETEDALLYLAKTGAVILEGGFFVAYFPMQIRRLVSDNKIKYKQEDYRQLSEHYRHRMQQIHIVGEYANLMVRDYDAALEYVKDYFGMDFRRFIAKYFGGKRKFEIERNITPAKYRKYFGNLSEKQGEIIGDDVSRHIVVAAGPGSGKTRVLVSKLAAVLQMEDVKHEELQMLTFSRAAATDFKKKLTDLIGDSAYYVSVKTFHSYCFDLIGQIGTLEESGNVVRAATEAIRKGEAEPDKINKKVLVIDEAQDMDADEYALVEALMEQNEDMRVIAVGDDDQNIYEFRGSSSEYLRRLIDEHGAKKYEMTDNFRSCRTIADFADAYSRKITDRMKTAGCRAVSREAGTVRVVRHSGGNLEIPVARQVAENARRGTVCVLTWSNEEALRVMGLLNRAGVPARYIQSSDGIRLNNLAELRFFMDRVDGYSTSAVISETGWDETLALMRDRFKGSTCLGFCENLLSEFRSTALRSGSRSLGDYKDAEPAVMYKTDLREFMWESKPEDYCEGEKGIVQVSTIHQSKGREFDTVYMLLDRVSDFTDEERRKIYVGITRAKRELFIHCNTGIFSGIADCGAEFVHDPASYPEPDEMVLQATYKDVHLDYFKGREQYVERLRSGDALVPDGDYLRAVLNGESVCVTRFSKRFRDRLAEFAEKGYVADSAEVRFVLYWKGQEDETETLIILPDVRLKKRAGEPSGERAGQPEDTGEKTGPV